MMTGNTLFRNLFSPRGMGEYLNLVGLTMAFVVFYVLMTEVLWVNGFNRQFKDEENIYFVSSDNKSFDGEVSFFSAQCFVEMQQAMEELDMVMLVEGGYSGYRALNLVDTIAIQDTIEAYTKMATERLFKVFDFDWVEGDTSLFHNPQYGFIPLSLAKQLYGDEGPYVGRKYGEADKWSVTVGGVYRDFPANCTLSNCCYKLPKEGELYDILRDRSGYNHSVFMRLPEGMQPEWVADELLVRSEWLATNINSFFLIPIHEMYSLGTQLQGMGGSFFINRLLLVVAILILVIAVANYINFSVAVVPFQIKSINLRRVLGEESWRIRFRMVGTGILIVFCSFLLALGIIGWIAWSGVLDDYLMADLTLEQNRDLLLIMGCGGVFLPFVAVAYPAWYATSRKPALVVNGGFALSSSGQKLRILLISIQFFFSFVVIMLTLLISMQNHYLYTDEVNYARDSLLYVRSDGDMSFLKERLPELLKDNPDVKSVAWCSTIVGITDRNQMKWGRGYHEDRIAFYCYPAEPGLLETMGIRLTEGRDFQREDFRREAFIFNESARKYYNLQLGDSLMWGGNIVGFVRDFKFGTARVAIAPMAFYYGWTNNNTRVGCIRLASPDKRKAVEAFIQEWYASCACHVRSPLVFDMKEEVLEQSYAKERRLFSMLLLASVISLLISIIGVFGLLLYETESRRKEMGVRKIFGATTGSLVRMFNLHYLRILCCCFVLATPVAYVLYQNWIESFAYRTPLRLWLFAVSFLIVAAVVCVTVTIQCFRASKEQPMKMLQI